MDLFSITCTTCKTRLKVREESAIGQILACPKCGGMVMVRPPEGWQKGQPAAAAAVEAPAGITTVVEVRRPEETLGDSQFDAIEELLGDAPPRPRPSNVSVARDAPGLARPRFVDGPPVPASHSGSPPPSSAGLAEGHIASATDAAPTLPASGRIARPAVDSLAGGAAVAGRSALPAASQAGEAMPAASADHTGDADKPPPPAEAESAATDTMAAPAGALRYWLMMGGSVAAGIALALAVVIGMVWFFKAERQSVATAASATPTALVPANLPGTAAATPSATSATGRTHHAGSAPQAGSASETADSPDAAAPAVSTDSPANSPADQEGEPRDDPPPIAVAADEGTPAAAPEADPLGLTTPAPVAGSRQGIGDPLAKFDTLIGGDAQDPTVTATDGDTAPPAAEVPMRDDEPAATPALPRPPPRNVDVAARLADPVPGIETSGTPLADFLGVISDFSTVPIVLETEGLPLVRVTPESSIVIKGTNTTVGGALTAALSPLGLEHVPAGGHVVVRVIEPAEMPVIGFPVKDLTGGDEGRMAELAEAMTALVAPASWNAEARGGEVIVNADKGTLDIRQRRAVHAQLLIAFEKLRIARKLPLATGAKYDRALFSLETRGSRAQSRLQKPVSLTFAQPASFVRILDQLEHSGDVRILVDWGSLAEAGWNADGEATLVADNQPLADALNSLLLPMDLAWRAIDSRTIEVTTPSKLAESLELEFYPAGELTAGDPAGAALISRIQSALGEEQFAESGGRHLRYDEASKCLLASLPQPLQHELEGLLDSWRGAAGK